MGLTNFPNGLASYGAPVVPGAYGRANRGKHWFVHGNTGSGNGKSPTSAFRTMDQAFDVVGSGDTIHVQGNIAEQLTTPAGVFDVTIIGETNRHRHPDAHTGNNGYSSAIWKAPSSPTAATPLLKIQQQGWRIVNMLFAAPTDDSNLNAAVQLYRDAGSGDAERDASHAEFYNCRFASGRVGINDTGGCFNVVVRGCIFQTLTNWAILGVGNIGVGQSMWIIEDNHFYGFTNGVKIAAHGCRIKGNTFTDGGTPNTTVVLNTNNGGGADNFVVYNYFQTATANFNTPDVVGTATDVWFNVSIDATSAGVGGNYEAGQPA